MLSLSLRSKTILGTAIIEAVLLVALVISAVLYMTKTANENLIKRADTTARLFATMSKDAVLSYDLAALDAFVNDVMSNPDIRYARVLNKQGEVFAVAGNNNALGREFVADTDLTTVNDMVFDSFALIKEGGDTYGRVEVGIGIDNIQQSLATIKQWMGLIALTEMFLVALFSFLLGNYLTHQLDKLKLAAANVKKAIGTGNFSDSKVEITSHDEVGAVALNFNLLVDKLDEQSKQTKVYQQELERFNLTLEEKINTRTAEILGKNEQLQHVNMNLKQAQQQLVQAEKLSSMGQLAAGLAHEVNNPIGFVSSNLDTLKRYIGLYDKCLTLVNQAVATEDEKVKNKIQTDIQSLIIDQDMHFVSEDMAVLLNDMEEGLQRVTEIVQNMTVFSRVDGDKKQFFNINDCIRSTYKMVKKQVSEKADLTLDLQEVPEVEMNVGKINQVITNLIINASQAMISRGTIKVFSKLKDNNIIVYVSDTGCGIPQAALDKIFDPFYTTKKEGEGTGLGLAISYDIIAEHGGELNVSSKENKGTVFTLTLPVTNSVLH